jgi:hypothetical protein
VCDARVHACMQACARMRIRVHVCRKLLWVCLWCLDFGRLMACASARASRDEKKALQFDALRAPTHLKKVCQVCALVIAV